VRKSFNVIEHDDILKAIPRIRAGDVTPEASMK